MPNALETSPIVKRLSVTAFGLAWWSKTVVVPFLIQSIKVTKALYLISFKVKALSNLHHNFSSISKNFTGDHPLKPYL